MSGYREEKDQLPRPSVSEMKTFSVLTLAPVLVGFFLLATGFGRGSYILVGLGLILLVASPFIIRRIWRRP
jgi:hypothetical protein